MYSRGLFLFIGMILGIVIVVLAYKFPLSPTAIPVVPAGNKVPDRFWLQDYQTLLDLQDEINQIQKRDGLAVKNDQLRGLASRLNAQVPAGYTFDEPSRSFKPNLPPPVATPAPAAAAPQPAPAATSPPAAKKPPKS